MHAHVLHLLGHVTTCSHRMPLCRKCRDTGTFFDSAVGFLCGYSGPYMAWSGDDIGYGGLETVRVNLALAHERGFFSTATKVSLRAGWFTTAGGSGPATVAVSFIKKGAQQKTCTKIKTIAPGSQSDCASAIVGTVHVTASGSAGQETLQLSLSGSEGALLQFGPTPTDIKRMICLRTSCLRPMKACRASASRSSKLGFQDTRNSRCGNGQQQLPTTVMSA